MENKLMDRCQGQGSGDTERHPRDHAEPITDSKPTRIEKIRLVDRDQYVRSPLATWLSR